MSIFTTKNNNKKLLFLVCITTLLLTFCITNPKAKIIFDDSIPKEKTAWICPVNVGTITEYNEIRVDWKNNAFSFSFIQIPAGNTLLEWDINANIGNTNYRADNILFRYNFLAGKQYLLYFGRDPNPIEGETGAFGIKLYMYDMGETISGSSSEMDKHFSGFAPFLNLNTKKRTVLE